MAASEKLRFDVKLAFGAGQFAEGLKNVALTTFLLFFYNQVLGVSGSLAGLAVGIALVVDAFTDPVAGSVSDHWKSPQGRRHPFMYASILPLMAAFFLLFNPLVSSELGLFVWMVAFSNATRLAMSLYHVPHIALGAEMTEDFHERSKLVGYRMFFSYLGSLFTFVVAFLVFFVPTPEFANGQLNAAAYAPFAMLLSILMGITIFWSAWGTRSVIPSLPKPPDEPRPSLSQALRRVARDIRAAGENRSFRWLFLGVLVVFAAVGVIAGLDLYVFTYFWEFERGTMLVVIAAYVVGVMLGTLVAPAFFSRFGKKAGLIFGATSFPLFQSTPIVARLMDWFPENGDPTLAVLLTVLRLVQGACTAHALVAFSSIVADIVDEHELETGQRREGTFFAAVAFSAKATSGLGGVVAGIALDVIAWPRGAHIQSAADIAPETIINLGLVYGPVIGAFGLFSVWCYSHLRLTRARHAEILEELAVRRAGSA